MWCRSSPGGITDGTIGTTNGLLPLVVLLGRGDDVVRKPDVLYGAAPYERTLEGEKPEAVLNDAQYGAVRGQGRSSSLQRKTNTYRGGFDDVLEVEVHPDVAIEKGPVERLPALDLHQDGLPLRSL